jgi:hypothetical protein
LTFANTWLSNNSIHLSSNLEEEAFSAVMSAVVKGLTSAYAQGYVDAKEGR